MVFTSIALECELVEIVAIRYLVDLMIQLITASEASSLAGNYDVRGSAAGGLPTAMPNCRIGFTSVGTDIDAIFPGALDLEGQIRCIYFELIVVIQMPNSHDD